ncbi:MAG TPA: 1-acyl-sn-glycerol-3-phosphate acyltransferase [Bacteroidales bacterium]
MKWISYLILKMMGWTTVGGPPEGVKKAIFITAPHTSNLDFFIGRMYAWTRKLPIKTLIKKEAFFWPFGGLLKKTGGIPIDRSKASNSVEMAAEIFNQYDTIYMAITPEGTRKLVKHWKKGFYYIAQKANVPIVLSFLDYKNKIVGIGPILETSGDIEKDFKKIEDFYRGMQGRHPEKFNLS